MGRDWWPAQAGWLSGFLGEALVDEADIRLALDEGMKLIPWEGGIFLAEEGRELGYDLRPSLFPACFPGVSFAHVHLPPIVGGL